MKVYLTKYVRDQCKHFFSHIDRLSSSTIVVAVKQMIELKISLDQVAQVSFKSNEMLKNAMKDGFDMFLNSDCKPDESAKKLAYFMHKVMQKENPLSHHRSLREEIKKVPFPIIIELFRHLMSKDVFENFFTTNLSIRLLKR